MVVLKIHETQMRKMVAAASAILNHNAEYINSLNVFPVPDGDTGTNMSLTFASGAKYVSENTEENVGQLTKSLAKGLLMGARGNSGVILSQIFRGFSKACEDFAQLDASQLANALTAGAKTAYQAVMKPQEGTILTVARLAAKAAKKAANDGKNVTEVMQAASDAAKEALATTPELLPVLKEVGVVDSGGQGLCFVYQGFYEALSGTFTEPEKQANLNEMVAIQHHKAAQSELETKDIEFGYCTEIMVKLGDEVEAGQSDFAQFDYAEFKQHLAEIGNSLLVIADDEVVKVHVHTNEPGTVLSYGQKFGALVKVKVDNMRLQHETIVDDVAQNNAQNQAEQPQPNAAKPEVPTGDYGIVAVASGAGLAQLFTELGVTNVVSGGQTMNPSTADLLAAINATNAKQVLVLPNNKNIMLAAKAAAKEAAMPCVVIPSKTELEGLSALVSFNYEVAMDENAAEMQDAIDNVQSGSVTTAVRDTVIDGVEIKKDNYIAIANGKIVATNSDLVQTTIELAEAMLDEDSEIVTLIYGDDATKEQADEVVAAINQIDDELEIELHAGNQPVYPFLLGVE